MADSFIAVPKQLKDEQAIRLFFEALVTEINRLREENANLQSQINSI